MPEILLLRLKTSCEVIISGPFLGIFFVGNANLFTKCLFTILVPLNPPLPTSKVRDFLEFLLKGP